MKKIKCYCLPLAVLMTAVFAQAQTQTAAPASASQLKMLTQLEGYWEAQAATMQMADKKYTFAYYADFKTTADNNGLTMNEWCTIPEMGKLNGANLIGVDPNDGKVHWFSVDNMGTTHEHVGEFADSRHFTMVHRDMREGKEYVETVVLEFTGPDKMNLNIEATLDGKREQLVTGMFQRKTAKGTK